MGSESKAGNTTVDGVHSISSDVKVVERPIMAIMRPYDVFLRFLGMCLTLVATIIVGVDKESKTISYAGMHLQATAKWEYMSATVFFLVSNAIACSYAATSLLISAIARSSGNYHNVVTVLGITIIDLIMVALLFSANGAAYAVGLIGKNGNSHVQWMKVCNVFDAYCRHMTAALVLSLIGSTVFLFMVAHSLLKLHYKSI